MWVSPGVISTTGRSRSAKVSRSALGSKPGSNSRWQRTSRVVHSPGASDRSMCALHALELPAEVRPRRVRLLPELRYRLIGHGCVLRSKCDLHPDLGARIAVVVRHLAEPVARGRAAAPPPSAAACRAAAAEAEAARLLEAALHQPPAEAAPLAGRADPHALELAEPRRQAPHPRRADHLARGVLHHAAWRPTTPSYSARQSATSWSRSSRVERGADMREVRAELPLHRRASPSLGRRIR